MKILKEENKSVSIEKIYFDMDGVLANFDKGVTDLADSTTQSQSSKDDSDTWTKIKSVTNFYAKLEPMPGALELFNELYSKYGNKVEILSAIPKPKRGIPTAKQDKIDWIRDYISDAIKVNIVYREEKKDFAKNKGCILIDDLQTNIKEWNEAGGTGILYTTPQSVLERINKLEGNTMELKLEESVMLEDKIVKFGGETFPKEGWCVIMAGGPASGKSTTLKYLIGINGKSFDPDNLSAYIHDKSGDEDSVTIHGKTYDISKFSYSQRNLGNTDYTNHLHNVRNDSGLQSAKLDTMFNAARNGKELPNLIFDTTGAKPEKISGIAVKAKELGYKVSLVYVFADIDRQLAQNSSRDRQVNPKVVKEITRNVYRTLIGATFSKDIDEAWVVFNSGYDLSTNQGILDNLNASNVFQIKEIGEPINLSVGDVENFINSQLVKLDSPIFEEGYYRHFI